jgi:hypothetical protein
MPIWLIEATLAESPRQWLHPMFLAVQSSKPRQRIELTKARTLCFAPIAIRFPRSGLLRPIRQPLQPLGARRKAESARLSLPPLTAPITQSSGRWEAVVTSDYMVTTETPAMSSSQAEARMIRWEERTRTAPPASSLAVAFTSRVTTECMLLISRPERPLRRLLLIRP